MKSSTRLKKYLEKFVNGRKSKFNKLFEFANKRERGRCGFEKWLQFELMLFFREQGAEVKLEKKIRPDKRKKPDKAHFQTDIVVSMSGESLGLELKVRRLAKYAVQALLSDIKKHGQTRGEDKATSNFSVVLCGEDIDEEHMKKLKLNKELSNFFIIKAGRSACLLMAQEPE